ncbi:unnamed protein product [Acanthoscelides obtectus]|uniref:Uncharacterized protein n=1 Tax=Acanthoscelides obtectus TaxID=200917 RepID=A0A9P0LJK5_ACAOB|nr:unnamed protein product [Acanthoscelides obtectus]CAK1642019.1 hypothetical protein AOBTE_LOCUS12793 [Acanthoscelides obtectus]
MVTRSYSTCQQFFSPLISIQRRFPINFPSQSVLSPHLDLFPRVETVLKLHRSLIAFRCFPRLLHRN